MCSSDGCTRNCPSRNGRFLFLHSGGGNNGNLKRINFHDEINLYNRYVPLGTVKDGKLRG